MILVDTSVWIDHMREPIAELTAALKAQSVLGHEMVIGELACGNLPNRDRTLDDLKTLPAAAPVATGEVLAMIDTHAIMGRGIGYVDASLLSSVLAHGDASLWTSDKRLRQIAEELGIAHKPDGGS